MLIAANVTTFTRAHSSNIRDGKSLCRLHSRFCSPLLVRLEQF